MPPALPQSLRQGGEGIEVVIGFDIADGDEVGCKARRARWKTEAVAKMEIMIRRWTTRRRRCCWKSDRGRTREIFWMDVSVRQPGIGGGSREKSTGNA